MKTSSLLACTLLTASGLAHLPQASAQTAHQKLHPADPATAVPAPVYQSPYAAPAKDADEAPIDWRQANAAVGQFTRGHMDLLKWEASQPAPGAMLPSNTPPAMRGMAH